MRRRRSLASAGARPAAWPMPSIQIATSRSATPGQSFVAPSAFPGARASPAPRACPRPPCRRRRRTPSDAGHAVRELERGVEDDRAGPRAADQHCPLEPGRVHHGDEVGAVRERRVHDVGATEAAQVVAHDPVPSRQGLPLQVPLAHVRDAGVREDHPRPGAGPLGPEPTAGYGDPAFAIGHLVRLALQVDGRPGRPQAVGRRHRRQIAAGVEDRDDVALGHVWERVVLREHVARLVDVARDRHEAASARGAARGAARSPAHSGR